MHKLKQSLEYFLFFCLAAAVAYLTFFSSGIQVKKDIKVIEISGGSYLSEEQYLKFARLNDPETYGSLNLSIIKDRIEKHPYIKRADVKYSGKNKIKVVITEKKAEAVLIKGAFNYLVSNEYEILPILPDTKNIDYPIISNLPGGLKIKEFGNVKSSEMQTAFRMIEAAKLVDSKYYLSVSEIYFQSKDIFVYFSEFNFPVKFGNSDAVKKMVYFNKIWQNLNSVKSAGSMINYIDLRFDNKIYIGTNDRGTEA